MVEIENTVEGSEFRLRIDLIRNIINEHLASQSGHMNEPFLSDALSRYQTRYVGNKDMFVFIYIMYAYLN